MKKSKYLRNCVKTVVCSMMGCLFLAGCGVRDSAVVFSIGETETSAGSSGAEAAEKTDFGNGDSEYASGTPEQPQEEDAPVIFVYVCGAVTNPGVVELAEGSRADAALQAAGGFAEDACRDYVNLAARVADGEKLYFPSVTESEALRISEEAEENGLVNINTANAEALMTLPGIGETRAQDIISYREEHGAFQKKEDLQKVSGIKENMYEKLCDKIIVQ